MSQKPFVFTLMPFHSDFNDIWKLGIKDTCEKLGTYCERVDEQIYEETMLERIYNQINKADIIVADMTGKNPNVFYEVGYAHALNKRVILIIQDSSEIPFDLKHHSFIVYEKSITTLKEKLMAKVQYFISNPTSIELPETKGLEFYLNSQKIENDKTYPIDFSPGGRQLYLKIDVKNNSNKILSDFQIGLVTPKLFYLSEGMDTVKLPNQTYLHMNLEVKFQNLYPSSFKKILFRIHHLPGYKIEHNTIIDCCIRTFDFSGTTDLQFHFNLQYPSHLL